MADSTFALHDATLLRLAFTWESRCLRATIQRNGTWSLIATRVTAFSTSARHAWGPSVSINEVRGPVSLDDGTARLEIEMQSGDTIVVEAERFELRRVDPADADRLDAWVDGASVQIIAVSSFGDPMDCGGHEARRFAEHILALVAFDDITPQMIGGAPWPAGWQPVADPAPLEAELARELPIDHVLAGKRVRALARRGDSDDALFLIDESQPALAVVHLTWSGRREQAAEWPATQLFGSVDAFVRAALAESV